MRKQAGNEEKNRWFEGVCRAEAEVQSVGDVIHAMDREGDSYRLFCQMMGGDDPKEFKCKAA